MAAPVELIIKVLADTKNAQSGLDSVKDSSGQLSRGLQTGANVVLAAGAAVGVLGLSAVKAAEESAKANAALDQVFTSMGDSTGKAADDARAYAEELMNLTAIDDEVIIAAQTQLATFGKVSDETARGAGIFDRATAAAADLAAAGFGSMDSNAVQLGKALQDPVKGLAALAKSGVTFTEAEKEQIKTMVEAGQVTEAQTMVLAAIEKQVGGTAAATATGSEKMATAFGEAQESIGGALLPAFTSLTKTITEDLLPAIEPMIAFFSEHIDIILPLAGILLGVAVVIKLVAVAQGIWNAVMLASPITWIILGLVALIAVIVLIIAKWDEIVAATKKAWEAIVAALSVAWDWIKQTTTAVWNGIKDLISGVVTAIQDRWNAAVGFFLGIRDRVVAFFGDAISWLKDAGERVITGLWEGLKAAWENITTWLGTRLDNIISFYANAGRWLYDVGKKIIEGLWDGLKDMWSNVTGWLGDIGDTIADIKGPPSRDARLLVGAGKLIMGGLQSGLEAGWTGVASYLGSRSLAIEGGIGGRMAPAGGTYTMNMYPRKADPQDVAWGFRRLELLKGYR